MTIEQRDYKIAHMPETQTTCPFCKKMSIRVLHIPFVSNTFSSSCRAGGKNTKIQKEGWKVLSGCPDCNKPLEEIKSALEHGTKHETHEDKLKRLRNAGLPLVLESQKH